MRVSIIGCGSIGARHARNTKSLGHTPIVYDRDVAKAIVLSAELECSIGTVRDADATLICTPASTHSAVARWLLDGGYSGPLFVEKPLALSVDDAAVFTTWPHPVTMVGYQCRFHHYARSLKLLVPNAKRGQFQCFLDMSTWTGSSYGPPILEMSHEIDMALWCGAEGAVTLNHYHGLEEDRFKVSFRIGEFDVWLVEADTKYSRSWWIDSDKAEGRVTFQSPEELGDQMYIDEVEHFLDCVEKHTPTTTPFADGLRVLDVAEQVIAAAVSHR